ncbi:MAG: hypothetical protein V7651_04100 [Hyphomonas oceanitis]|uniref:hypothetical protein n=1 Tax=Hyphomonas oceanitis TaxID=81033 RepID=UPI00300137D0
MSLSSSSGSRPDNPYWLLFGCFLLVGAGLLLMDGPPGNSYLSDVDDIARRLQIADLLTDGQWHDASWPFLQTPDVYQSPWSRLVDAPYVFITWALSPFMGTDGGFRIARLVVPPLWFVVYAALTVRVMQHLTGRRPGSIAVGMAALASFLVMPEFYPARIDHHNVQLVLMMALSLGLVSPNRHAGLLVGLASFLSIAVGLECTPFIAVALVGLGLVAVWTGEAGHIRRFGQAGLSLGLLTLPGSLVLIGPSGLGQVYCDAISAPWILALSVGGGIIALAPRLWGMPAFSNRAARFASLVIPGVFLLAGLWIAFPQCHHGPLYMVDPIAKEFWLSRVLQEHDFISLYAEGGPRVLVFGPVALTGVLIAIWTWTRPRTAGAGFLYAIAVAAVALALLQNRNFPFAASFAALFVPGLVQAYGRASSLRTRLVPLVLPLLAITVIIIAVRRTDPAIDLIMVMKGDACLNQDLSVLDTAPPGIIMAPPRMSFTLAEYNQTSGGHHPVASLPFHRAAPSISRVAQTFTRDDADGRREALAPFDYVAVCRMDLQLDRAPAPLFGALAAGENWPGLIDVLPDSGSRFRLMRIDHDALQ